MHADDGGKNGSKVEQNGLNLIKCLQNGVFMNKFEKYRASLDKFFYVIIWNLA